jgi:starvation-inducible DNA-binding protein
MTTATQPKLHATQIDIPEENRMRLIEALNLSLATALDLKTQVKQAHWNVKGMDFYQLHELFDELAGELEAFVDTLAERATILGGVALGTARMAVSASILPEYPSDIFTGKAHVEALVKRYGLYANQVRASIDIAEENNDADTADLFTEVSRGIDKRLWFLEAHIQA